MYIIYIYIHMYTYTNTSYAYNPLIIREFQLVCDFTMVYGTVDEWTILYSYSISYKYRGSVNYSDAHTDYINHRGMNHRP